MFGSSVLADFFAGFWLRIKALRQAKANAELSQGEALIAESKKEKEEMHRLRPSPTPPPAPAPQTVAAEDDFG